MFAGASPMAVLYVKFSDYLLIKEYLKALFKHSAFFIVDLDLFEMVCLSGPKERIANP